MILRQIICAALSITLCCTSVFAQQRKPATSPEIYAQLQRLNRLCSVMYVAAHPDDENTRLLAWLVNGTYVRTSYLSLTRGDGGQNILGQEQGSALGLIRTYELLEARKLDGPEQYFTRAIDFGFSKNPDETFTHWDRKALLGDIVWAYRTFRPDVVICRFPKDSMAGHGQHSASAILAEEAYALSGKTSEYSNQLSKTTPWTPTRILLNAFRFGNRSTIKEGMFKLDVGQYNPLNGMGFGELAGISRSIHRSQGAGTPSTPGIQAEYFGLLAGKPLSSSLFEGIDTTWNRVGAPEIGASINTIIAEYSMLHPAKSVASLLTLRKQISGISDKFWREQKLREVDEIILNCLGIVADASVSKPTVIAGDTLATTVRITARAEQTIQLNSVVWPDGTTHVGLALEHDSLKNISAPIHIPKTTPVTQPYWLEQESVTSTFLLSSNEYLGLPATPSLLNVLLHLEISGEKLTLTLPLSYKKLHPLRGDVIEQLRVVPVVSVEPEQPIVLVQSGAQASIPVKLRAFATITNASIDIISNGKTLQTVKNISVRANTDSLLLITLPTTSTTTDYTIDVVLNNNGQTFSRALKTIQYDHLPTLQYTKAAMVKIVHANWNVSVKRVAFIEGAGDYMPEFLRLAGITVDEIEAARVVKPEELLTYDAVITGVRCINTNKTMQFVMPSLLRYVEMGGTLLMQYNTLQDMSTKQLGPYPFTLTSKRVTEEHAAVTISDATSRLLTTPNTITQDDFKGWVQERGLYFADQIDPHYQTPLVMNDQHELPQNGSVLYTPFGKGHYIYCSLSLFRQLPAGVSGSMRLLMNMLSVGK